MHFKKLRTNFLITAVLLCLHQLSISSESWVPNKFMVGYGESIPGFGETTETVRTADFVFRWEKVLQTYDPSTARFRAKSHQFWIETGAMVLISDSDTQDSKDFGLTNIAFISAWTFDLGKLEPYIFVGGGPVYVFADITGVGSDICGNYQSGVGIRGFHWLKKPMEIQLKYLHISNLEMADPNVALNTVRVLIALGF